MKKLYRPLSLFLAAAVFSGCAAMKEGMANLNQMAIEQQTAAQAQRLKSWKADIARGSYSGQVKVALFAAVPEKKGKTGIDPARATASLKKHFADHAQFELLDDKKTDSLKRDLNPFGSSLSAAKVKSGAARRQNMGGVDADVLLRTGLRMEQFVGINKKTNKIGKGIKVVCWTEYLVIGADTVTKGKFEETNIFKNEQAIVKAAQSFHAKVLNELMVDHLKTRVAAAEKAQIKAAP